MRYRAVLWLSSEDSCGNYKVYVKASRWTRKPAEAENDGRMFLTDFRGSKISVTIETETVTRSSMTLTEFVNA